jgi:hypothetical protein
MILVAGFSVYALNIFERAWGRGGSFQVVVLLGLVFSVVGCIGYVLAAVNRRAFPSKRKALSLGASFAIALVLVLIAMQHLTPAIHSIWSAVVVAFLMGAVSSLGVSRKAA